MIKFLFFLFFMIECRAKDLKDVELCFYENSLAIRKCFNVDNVKNDFKTLPESFYNPQKENLIFIMGWQPQGSINESRDDVLGAFFAHKRDEYNIAEVEWGKYVVINCPMKVLPYINPVIATVNQIVSEIYQQGFKTNSTYAIGFSFGALVAGGIGRHCKNVLADPLRRITALDPPAFFGIGDIFGAFYNLVRVSRDDAKFVDVIHSNAMGIGDYFTRGHADFWPNGGSKQKGCELFIDYTYAIACNHARSYKYYAESVGRSLQSQGFKSKECMQYALIFDSFLCEQSSPVSMGFYADKTFYNPKNLPSINNYLETNEKLPFSKD